MWRYLGRRLLQMVITLLLFQVGTYLLLDAQPGDISDLLITNPNIPRIEQVRLQADLGLDKPPLARVLSYIINFYQGDLGVSFQQYPKPVIEIIRERLPRTIVLFLTANIVSFWAGFVTGKLLAWRRGGFIEYTSTIAGVTLYTIFTPWFALMMIWLFAVYLGWLPTGKFLDPVKWMDTPPSVTANGVFTGMLLTALVVLIAILVGFLLSNLIESRYRYSLRVVSVLIPIGGVIIYWWLFSGGIGYLVWDILSHILLPVLTLTLVVYGGTMLLVRTSMLETIREDYILTARAKGLPEKVVRDKHAARNALLPVWTGLVFSIGQSVGGGIIIETIFSWPGIGLAYLNAVTSEDIPVAMGALTIIGVMTLISHLIADIGYAFLDPRIRYN